MKYLISRSKKGEKISDLAGSWDVSDEEVKEIKASISQAWENHKNHNRHQARVIF
jgi:hypothetical protein